MLYLGFNALSWFQPSLSTSLLCITLVWTLCFTSKLHLGFNVFLHFKALSWFQPFHHFNAFLHFGAEVTSSVTKFLLSLYPSISHQCSILVSNLSFTSKLHLGFNALLHFKALSWLQSLHHSNACLHFDAEVTSSVTKFFFNLSLSIWHQRFTLF